ncbi:MAG TPA: xanthine dehydrogenase family protein subunit M [Solirubrobacteraceae bacterium]|nr:xanthine dehydrogenase family protein subunit M [Solirubrobacteraceae bacterium]
MTSTFEYLAPDSRDELLGLLADRGPTAKLLAGGTDLLVDLRNDMVHPECIVNLKKVPGYSEISWSEEDGVRIGAAVTINDVLHSQVILDSYPLLVDCASDLASYQIRNRATVVGNVVNASPCSDMAPALLCLGASAVIASHRGRRVVPFTDFFRGVKRTVLEPDEILETIVVPAESANGRGGYRKLKRIKGHDLGIVGVALFKKDGVLRLGVSSCAPTPILVGGLPADAPADQVVAAVGQAVNPISDLRCSKEYREHMVAVFTRRLLREVK